MATRRYMSLLMATTSTDTLPSAPPIPPTLALALNSFPRSPILPPHSGHIKFKMPETSSWVVLRLLVNLMNLIFPSLSQMITVQSQIALWRSASQVPDEKDLSANLKMKSNNARPLCPASRGQKLVIVPPKYLP
jgi:hypothetical protein